MCFKYLTISNVLQDFWSRRGWRGVPTYSSRAKSSNYPILVFIIYFCNLLLDRFTTFKISGDMSVGTLCRLQFADDCITRRWKLETVFTVKITIFSQLKSLMYNSTVVVTFYRKQLGVMKLNQVVWSWFDQSLGYFRCFNCRDVFFDFSAMVLFVNLNTGTAATAISLVNAW